MRLFGRKEAPRESAGTSVTVASGRSHAPLETVLHELTSELGALNAGRAQELLVGDEKGIPELYRLAQRVGYGETQVRLAEAILAERAAGITPNFLAQFRAQQEEYRRQAELAARPLSVRAAEKILQGTLSIVTAPIRGVNAVRKDISGLSGLGPDNHW